MRNETIAFAVTHPMAHIAVVSTDHRNAHECLHATRDALRPFVKDVNLASMKMHLLNGTCIYFATADYHRLRGWQFDRIEVMPGVAHLLPEGFLATRLKPGIVPEEGIVYLSSPEPETGRGVSLAWAHVQSASPTS